MGKTYVISDIHGHKEEFHAIKRKIQFSAEDKMYILGDVVDRGPESISILKEVMKTPNIELLLGNHEMMMSDYLKYERMEDIEGMRKEMMDWYSNGGEITHKQYMNETPQMQIEIYHYLRGLGTTKEIEIAGNIYVLVHGKPGYDKESTVWGRVDETTPILEGKTIIFGHTPTYHYQPDKIPMEVWKDKDGLIGIDCGMASKGRSTRRIWNLACMCLETSEVTYSNI